MITFRNFALRRGERLLLSEVDLSLHAGVRVGEFSQEQNAYLEYHRSNVFKRSQLDGH